MATGNVALLLVRTHNAGGVFSSREKPSVRHALVRLTPFPSIALTLSRFIFFAYVGIEARAHRSVLALSPQRRVIAGRGQSAGSWRRLGEHCQRNNNKNKHRLNISTFHDVARCALGETGSVRALRRTKVEKNKSLLVVRLVDWKFLSLSH